jgi:manganese/iron transport system permease protein
MEFLFEPFTHAFMQRGLAIALLVGMVCSVLSCYLILKGWSLMGDAISHAVFPGIVLAYVIGVSYVIGAFVAGLFCAVATGFIKEHSRLKEDTVMGVIFSGMFAFGLVLFTKVKTDQHLMHILFGNMLGVTWGDILETGLIVGGILLIILIKWREFLVYSFFTSYSSFDEHCCFIKSSWDYSCHRYAHCSGRHCFFTDQKIWSHDLDCDGCIGE